ncbi:hypothetical protein ACYCS5_17000 [Paenibacillus sp. SEL3]|jgi:hypothetical protein|uniref:hypothetical protein n=1 Tax=Paenibacillus TaxID=44249 RepID=UPI00083DE1CF|nr:hypothetical protein [Paenibacillus polymyxa]MBO3283178.1 hypothetical protein [Paenibacillus polymyxa]ODB56781.1 hypothetical protein A7311_00190 [Paenibacillus polymyxa]
MSNYDLVVEMNPPLEILLKKYFIGEQYEKIALIPFSIANEDRTIFITLEKIIYVPSKAMGVPNQFHVQLDPRFLKSALAYCASSQLHFGIIHNHLNKDIQFSTQDIKVECILRNYIFTKFNSKMMFANFLFSENRVNMRVFLNNIQKEVDRFLFGGRSVLANNSTLHLQ